MLLSKSPHQIQKGFIPVLQELHVFGIKHFSAEKKKQNKQTTTPNQTTQISSGFQCGSIAKRI